MKYEILDIEIIRSDSCDVITTSSDVTTGGIKLPWQTSNEANYYEESFNLLAMVNENGYEL